MANRLTYHSGYRNAMGKAYNGKHNQREGFTKEPLQTDTGMVTQNLYWNYVDRSGGMTFSEGEMSFYKRYLGRHIERQNKKAIERRQYGRTQTVAGYKEKHPPEEVLLYLGTENVNSVALEAVFQDFRDWLLSQWDKAKGGVMPLNAALHLDETTPHIHLRQVYLYRDKEGDWQVSQNKALAAMGYDRPDPGKPAGKYNNAKMTFTAACREKLFELARNYGVELETEPLPPDEVGLPLKEYVQRQQAREAATAELAGLQADIDDLQEEKEDVADGLERLRRSMSREQAAIDLKHKDAQEQAEKILEAARKEAQELKETAIREGAASARGQMYERMRKQAQEAQGKEVEHEGR